MSKTFRQLLLSKHFLISFIILPLFFIIVNIGLIFNIPNYLNITPNLIKIISSTKDNTSTLPLFIAFITIFILFFTFVQFTLSRSNLPSDIVRKYIIDDENTNRYIGHQLSLAVILAYFSITSPQIHNLNYCLIIILVLFAIIYSLLYFLWLVQNVTPSKIFRIILKKLNLYEIGKIESEAFCELNKYNDLLSKNELNIKVFSGDSFSLFLTDYYPINSSNRGFVKSIDVLKIDMILAPYKDLINKIVFDVNIGDYVPKYEPLPDRLPSTLIMHFEKKLPKEHKDELKQKDFEDKIYKEGLEKQLKECFIIEDREKLYKNNLTYIEDLFYFFINAIDKEPEDANRLLELLASFIIDNVEQSKNINWLEEVGLSENLFLKFIGLMENDINSKEIDSKKINTLLTFVYSFRNLAVKHKSFKLMSAIINLVQSIFYKVISDSNRFNSRLAIIILHIQEITLSTVIYGFPEPSVKEACRYWKSFYYPLIEKTIDSAISTFYLMIKYYHRRHEEDNYNNLIRNTQFLLDLLSPLTHYDPFDKISFSHPLFYTKIEKKIIYSYAQNLVHIAVIIFIKTKRRKLPKWFLTEIAFPICANCRTVGKYKYNSVEILNDLFFDYNFNHPFSTSLSEEFVINKVHQSGGFSPILFNFDLFWFAYSFYHKRNTKNFFPIKINKQSDVDQLHNYKQNIVNYKSEFIADSFDVSTVDLNKYVLEYVTHIENLLNEYTSENV